MTILDEDIPEDQYERLRSWRFRIGRIGVDVGWLGMTDREILTLLHSLNRPTFFSLDRGFFRRKFYHPGYCLAYLDVEEAHAAEYIRRTLRHHELSTRGRRMGTVLRVHPGDIAVWRQSTRHIVRLSWR